MKLEHPREETFLFSSGRGQKVEFGLWILRRQKVKQRKRKMDENGTKDSKYGRQMRASVVHITFLWKFAR